MDGEIRKEDLFDNCIWLNNVCITAPQYNIDNYVCNGRFGCQIGQPQANVPRLKPRR